MTTLTIKGITSHHNSLLKIKAQILQRTLTAVVWTLTAVVWTLTVDVWLLSAASLQFVKSLQSIFMKTCESRPRSARTWPSMGGGIVSDARSADDIPSTLQTSRCNETLHFMNSRQCREETTTRWTEFGPDGLKCQDKCCGFEKEEPGPERERKKHTSARFCDGVVGWFGKGVDMLE